LPAKYKFFLFCVKRKFYALGSRGRAFSFGLRGPMKKHLKSQMADFKSSRMFAGAAASNEKALAAGGKRSRRTREAPSWW
jgi:hypothetical protein